jgi:hypothetical protein
MAKLNALQLQQIQYLEYQHRQLVLATQQPAAKAVRYHPGLDATHEQLERQQRSDSERFPASGLPLIH